MPSNLSALNIRGEHPRGSSPRTRHRPYLDRQQRANAVYDTVYDKSVGLLLPQQWSNGLVDTCQHDRSVTDGTRDERKGYPILHISGTYKCSSNTTMVIFRVPVSACCFQNTGQAATHAWWRRMRNIFQAPRICAVIFFRMVRMSIQGKGKHVHKWYSKVSKKMTTMYYLGIMLIFSYIPHSSASISSLDFEKLRTRPPNGLGCIRFQQAHCFKKESENLPTYLKISKMEGKSVYCKHPELFYFS